MQDTRIVIHRVDGGGAVPPLALVGQPVDSFYMGECTVEQGTQTALDESGSVDVAAQTPASFTESFRGDGAVAAGVAQLGEPVGLMQEAAHDSGMATVHVRANNTVLTLKPSAHITAGALEHSPRADLGDGAPQVGALSCSCGLALEPAFFSEFVVDTEGCVEFVGSWALVWARPRCSSSFSVAA